MKNLEVTKWLRSGEFDTESINCIRDILEQAGGMLDHACSHEILGEVAFEAADGQVYVVTVEAVIGKINPEYLKDLKAEDEKAQEGKEG